MRGLPFEPETFDEIVDALDLIGLIGQRAPRVVRGTLCFVAVAKDGIGANEAHPAVYILAIGVQPVREPLHHPAYHLGARALRHILGRCNIGSAG
jgi:hypothetical protein